MPSEPLIPDNDYNFPPAPIEAYLDDVVWNGVMTSIGGRLRALEDVNSGIESIQEQLQSLGLQILDDAINPLIADTQASVADLAQQVSDTAAANAQIIADFQDVVAVNLEELSDDINAVQANLGAVQDEIDLILSGGIPADRVTEDDERVFVSPAQKARIESIMTELDGGTFS